MNLLRIVRGPGAGRTSRTGWWCEATVAAADSGREWLLGGSQVDGPERALRWLREQAPRLADRIDPCPDTAWAASGVLTRPRAATRGGADAAAMLRRWGRDGAAHSRALATLQEGALFALTVRDGDGLLYRLSARPLLARPASVPGRSSGQHRRPRARRRRWWPT